MKCKLSLMHHLSVMVLSISCPSRLPEDTVWQSCAGLLCVVVRTLWPFVALFFSFTNMNELKHCRLIAYITTWFNSEGDGGTTTAKSVRVSNQKNARAKILTKHAICWLSGEILPLLLTVKQRCDKNVGLHQDRT